MGFKVAVNWSNDTSNLSCLSQRDCIESVATVSLELIRFTVVEIVDNTATISG